MAIPPSNRPPTVAEYLLHFFWPARCAFCGKVVAPNRHCCADCRFSLVPSPSPFSLPGLDCAFACAEYTSPVARAIRQFKFRNQPQLADTFAFLICERFAKALCDCHPDTICAVAMHPSKKKERGYNQADLLAQALSQRLDIPFSLLLEKCRNTAAQHTLSATDRQQNLKDAYRALHPEQIRGKRILLVDDVITTGSTVIECARVLHQAGAVWVGAVCFARPFSPYDEQRIDETEKIP